MSSHSSALEQVMVTLTDMPALPTVVARLTRLIADPKTTANDINDALSADPGLVASILKLVNSPYYGFSRRITTITNAVVILGYNQVRNLALSAFIFDKFANARNTGFDINGLWKHSIGSAFLGAQIARHINPKMEEDAFICGLLHDLGKFIMACNAVEDLALVLEEAQRKDILFHAAEPDCLGYDHALLGAAVLEKWNLPETLVEVVRNHHQPMDAPEPVVRLACVTHTADIVARALLMGAPGDACIPRLTPEVWNQIGLTWEKLDEICRRVADEYSRSGEFFAR